MRNNTDRTLSRVVAVCVIAVSGLCSSPASAYYRKTISSTCAIEGFNHGHEIVSIHNSWGVIVNPDPTNSRVFDCAVPTDTSLDMSAVSYISTDVVNNDDGGAVGAAACVLYTDGSGGACGAYSYTTPIPGSQRLWLSPSAWHTYAGQYAYISYALPPKWYSMMAEIAGTIIYTP